MCGVVQSFFARRIYDQHMDQSLCIGMLHVLRAVQRRQKLSFGAVDSTAAEMACVILPLRRSKLHIKLLSSASHC